MSPRARARAALPDIPLERFRLDCGALLLVSRRPRAPVCAVQAHVRGGHSLDPAGLEGIASLAGRLVDQGTRARGEEEIAELLERVGGSLSGGSTGLSGTAAAGAWELLLELFCECLTEPTYPRAQVERQRTRLRDRLLVEEEDPRVQGGRLFRRLVYGEHWLGRSEHGTPDSVVRVDGAALRAFHRKNWCGKRAVLAFCGDVPARTIVRTLNRRLARWRPGTELAPPDERFPPLARRSGAFPAKRQQVHVFLGHLGIRRKDPDYAALVVMDHILGTGPGFTSRISRRLRDEQGLAYSVDAAIHASAGVLPGTFTAYIGTSPAHLSTAVGGFLEEIRRIQRELVAPEELELARRYLTGSFALGFERASRRANHLVAAQRNGLPDGHLAELLRRFEQISAQEVRDVARRHLHPDAACLAVAGPVAAREARRALASA